MLDTTSIATVILLGAASVLLLAAMLYPSAVLRWLQRKRYQYEVTFSLYMLTPTEKFIFNSFLFLFLSMIIIAASLYLPEHLTTIAHRVFYYVTGDKDASKVAEQMVITSTRVVREAATPFVAQGQGAHALKGNGRGYMEP